MNSSLKPASFLNEVAQQAVTKGGKDAKNNTLAVARPAAQTTVVVGAQTYRAWFSQLSSSLPVSIAVENRQELETHCRDLREQLRKMPMPAAIDVELRRELFALCQQGPVSVRSSASLEGSKGISTIATHDTYLGVVGVDAVVARIIDCFVSMWVDKAVKNRSERGGDPANISMHVVVKLMVDESQTPYRNLEECPDLSPQWV